MVSVIMPVYNAESFLEETVESVLNQSYSDFEFLIFNDGSTDSSLKILEKYKDPRFKLFNSDQNMGYLHWLNIGVLQARGKYIARMDADDIALCHRLERQVEFLEQNNSIDVLGSGVIIFNEKGKEKVFNLNTEENKIKWGFIFKNQLIHPSVMMRRDRILEAGLLYDEDYYGSEDYKFWTQALQKGLRVTNIADILLKYRDHGENFTKKNRDRQLSNSRIISKDYLQFLFPSIDNFNLDALVNKVYSNNPKDVIDLWNEFKRIFKDGGEIQVLSHLRNKMLDLFYENSKPTVFDVLRYRRLLSLLSNYNEDDGKTIFLWKHYLKMKWF